MAPLRIAGAGLLTYALCMAAGQILFRALKLKFAGAERWFLSFASGAACVSTVILALALLRCIYPAVLVVLAVAVLVAGMLCLRGGRVEPPQEAVLKRGWRIAFWVPYLAFGIYYLCAAMVPEVSADGVMYHVGLITRYFDRHGLFPMRTDMYANLPAGTEMLFLFAYTFGRHSSAAVVHLLFLLAMPFGIMAYARRMGQPVVGLAASLLFYTAPVVGKDGASAYNDVSTAASVFGCFYALQIWQQQRRTALLVPAGLLAGFAFACKYTAFSAVLYALGFAFISAWRSRQGVMRPLAILILLVLIETAPWMIKNVDYVGNPVYPFFARLFPNPYYPQRLEQDYVGYMSHTNGVSYAQIPWEVTVGGRLIGIVGPVFLLAPLALLSLRFPMGRQLLAAFAIIFLPYFGNIGTRFLIPSLPFLALALAAALARKPRLLIAATALHLILSWPNLIPSWAPPVQWRLEEFAWRAALRLEPEEKYLAQQLPDYRAGLLLDRLVPANKLIYAPSVGQISYHHRQLIGSALQARALDLLVTGYDPDRSVIRKRRYEFAPLRTRSIRLVLESRPEAVWRIHEMRFLRGLEELPRQPQWRIDASDDPWEIQFAFDNSPVSAWVSSRRASPGQWVRVDFGSPVELTGVVVEQDSDQQWTHQRLEALVEGEMAAIPARETASEETLEPGRRRRVAAELKAAGIEWLLLRDTDYGGEDVRRRAPYWGAVEMGNIDGYYLWHLN